jgi:hypothetical protein
MTRRRRPRREAPLEGHALTARAQFQGQRAGGWFTAVAGHWGPSHGQHGGGAGQMPVAFPLQSRQLDTATPSSTNLNLHCHRRD